MARTRQINRFKEARFRRGLTQQEVARMAGVSQPTVSGLETGAIKNPSWTAVYRLAYFYGVDPEELAPVRSL